MSTLAYPMLSDKRPRRIQRGLSGPTQITFRVATYNIWGGRYWPAALRTLRDVAADIVCLQEVVPDHRHFPGAPLPDEIAAAMGGSWRFELLWQKRTRPIGNMTISRGRVGPATVLTTGTSEPYGIVTPVVLDGAAIRVANLHLAPVNGFGTTALSFWPSEVLRMREMSDYVRRFGQRSEPAIVTGDFNSFRFAPAYSTAARRWRDCRRVAGGRHASTRPTYGLPFVIDHVFVSPHFEVRDYRVVDEGGSDHRLVMATVSMQVEKQNRGK